MTLAGYATRGHDWYQCSLRRRRHGVGRMNSKLRTVHRWLSLSVATFWVLQALTGVFLVFHWEIGDALVAGPARPLDLDRFDEALHQLVAEKPGRTISSIWATAG